MVTQNPKERHHREEKLSKEEILCLLDFFVLMINLAEPMTPLLVARTISFIEDNRDDPDLSPGIKSAIKGGDIASNLGGELTKGLLSD